MTDRELEARIAREVFGLKVEDRRLLQAPDTGEWSLCPWCNAEPPAWCPMTGLVPPERHPMGPAQYVWAPSPGPDNGWWQPVPFYLEDVGEAIRVADAMSARGCGLVLEDWRPLEGGPRSWAAYFEVAGGHTSRQVCADTVARAVCLAALGFLEGPK